MMKQAIVICSGGLDSVVTAHYAKNKLNYRKMIILFFNYNQRALKSERKFSLKCAKDTKSEFLEFSIPEIYNLSHSLINVKKEHSHIERRDLKDTKKESLKWYVPCRNLIFISYALALAESRLIRDKISSDIFLGFKSEGSSGYPDATGEFTDMMSKIGTTACNGKFKVIVPMIKKDKEDIVLLGNKLNVHFKDTFSCYTSDNIHCGSCLACMLRKEGFYWSGLPDPTVYSK